MTFRKTLVSLVSLVSLAILALATPAGAKPGDYTIVRSFPTPMTSPDGVAWDGTHVWTTECTSEDLYKLDPEGGKVAQKTTIKDAFIDHLTWDGKYLWGNDHHDKSAIHKIDPKTMKVIRSINVGWERLMGVAWDGKALWTTDPKTSRIYKLDPETGKVLDQFTFVFPSGNPQSQLCGIGWDGKCLWVGDLVNQAYHLVDPVSRKVELSIKSPGGAGNMPTGFAFDGRYVWVADENPQRPRLFQLDVEFPETGPCAHGNDEGQVCNPDKGPLCKSTMRCVSDKKGGAKVCRKSCIRGGSGAAACPAKHSCWELDGGAVCLADLTSGPSGKLGDGCSARSDCQSNLCVATGGSFACAESCKPSDPASCPTGYFCSAAAGGINACVATANEAGCGVGGGNGTEKGAGLVLLLLLLLAFVARAGRRSDPGAQR